MKAITKSLASGAAIAAQAAAAPAAAQYYPGYDYGGPYGGNVVGQVLQSMIGGGYGGYGVNSQAAVNRCADAVQQRLGGFGSYGYNGYSSPYGYAGGRVLGISRVEQRSSGGLTVRGVAASGRVAGYAPGGQKQVDLVWKCKTDYRGSITGINIDPALRDDRYNTPYANGYTYSPYDKDYDYSQYGYRRY